MKPKKSFIRDGRAPIPKNPRTSEKMSAIKAKNTKPELLFRKALWLSGLRGYRVHQKGLPGTPDVAFIGNRLAIFIHGCFWHRCPHCQPSQPKSNTEFWNEKFRKNVERDARKEQQLTEHGWRVLAIWECEVKSILDKKINIIKEILKK